MLKKILIAAVAVGLGVMVVGKVTKVSPMVWFRDCCNSARNMVPPEKQLEQLKLDIESIDKEIDHNLSTLARMSADVEKFEGGLVHDRNRQAHLRADIGDMEKSLKAESKKVVFRGSKTDAEDLTTQLDMAVTEYTCLKEKVKTEEKILTEKKRTYTVAKARIKEMRNEQEKLRLLAVQLEHELELLKMKQIQNQVTEFDNSALSRAQENAKNVETRLREISKLIELKKEFGRTETTILETEKSKSREEVLHAAKAALQDDSEAAEVTVEKNNE